jgi:ABC-2 type transport system permease protein
VWGAAFAVLLTIFIVVRHTRADEEAGRLELVGAAAVGRQAPLTAALLAAATANVAIALLTFLWLLVLKLPVGGSAALALSISGCGLVFGGVAAVAAQLAVTARGTRGIAIAVLGAAFVLRAVGDSGSAGLSWLSWVSPLGWVEFARAFGSAGERWWVLTLPLAASAVLVAAAFLLAAWRDHSAGLLPDRPGRASAASGAGANGIGSIIGGSAGLRRSLLKVGYRATIIDAYLSALMLIAGLAAAVYATSAVLRLRTEETGNLAEPVPGAATGRTRWGLSHISVAVTGACLLLAAAGLSTGLGYGILTGSVTTQLPTLLGAAVARLPAVIVLPAVAVLLFGLLPWESTALAWTVVALVWVIAVFGPPLQWPTWMMDISPFTQIPRLPGGTVSAQPLVWLCAVALTISTVGLIGGAAISATWAPPGRSLRSATGSSPTRRKALSYPGKPQNTTRCSRRGEAAEVRTSCAGRGLAKARAGRGERRTRRRAAAPLVAADRRRLAVRESRRPIPRCGRWSCRGLPSAVCVSTATGRTPSGSRWARHCRTTGWSSPLRLGPR